MTRGSEPVVPAASGAPSSAVAPVRDMSKLPDRLWAAMLLRAVPALIVAAVITFTPDHSPVFGFVTFGAFALATGILVGFEAVGLPNHPTRALTFTRSLVSVLAGGIALFWGTALADTATAGSLIIHIATWAVVTGVLELVSAWIARRRPAFSRDILLSGAITLLLGILIAVVPPDLRQEYGGVEQVGGALTASVQAVGFLGAYLAVLGVLLIIEGFTLRGAKKEAIAAKAAEAAVPDAPSSARASTIRGSDAEPTGTAIKE